MSRRRDPDNLPSRSSVKYFRTTSQNWYATTEYIEHNNLWAIVYDQEDKVWEVWVDGRVRGRKPSESKAESQMDQYLSGELEY